LLIVLLMLILLALSDTHTTGRDIASGYIKTSHSLEIGRQK